MVFGTELNYSLTIRDVVRGHRGLGYYKGILGDSYHHVTNTSYLYLYLDNINAKSDRQSLRNHTVFTSYIKKKKKKNIVVRSNSYWYLSLACLPLRLTLTLLGSRLPCRQPNISVNSSEATNWISCQSSERKQKNVQKQPTLFYQPKTSYLLEYSVTMTFVNLSII